MHAYVCLDTLRGCGGVDGWSPERTCMVDKNVATSRTPMPQSHGNGKSRPRLGYGNDKAFPWSKYGCWWMIDLYLKPVCVETATMSSSSYIFHCLLSGHIYIYILYYIYVIYMRESKCNLSFKFWLILFNTTTSIFIHFPKNSRIYFF